MTEEEWLMCGQVLATFYPHNFKVTDPLAMELWFDQLRDLPGERVIAAVKYMVKTQPAFPSVADIRKLAEPAPADPGEAWKLACQYVSQVSSGPILHKGEWYHAPKPAPWIMAAIEAVGMDAIRQRTPGTEGTLRAHFVRFYEARLQFEHQAAAGLRAPEGGKVLSIGELLPEIPEVTP